MSKFSIRNAVAREIKAGISSHLLDVSTAEAWTRHYFWSWYESAKKGGRDASIEAFLKEIPKQNLITFEERAEELRPHHEALFAEITEILSQSTDPNFKDEQAETKPTTPADHPKKSKKR